MSQLSEITLRAAVPAPKISIPVAPTNLIAREHLMSRLDACARTQITLMSAPAGYGKTTLLSGWAADRDRWHHGRVAWLSLDQHDDDVFLLWSAILAALGTADRAGSARLAQLSPPGDRMEPGFLAAFVDAVDEGETPVWLVLDDAHHLRDANAVDSLRLLLDNMPKRLRLVLACRVDPPVATLRRLRLAGRLGEIRRQRLAFTRREAVALLEAYGLRLSDADLELVLARTEGWAAALRLAGVVLANEPDTSAAVARFASDDRIVADYVFGEALARQPAVTRRFLAATSVCDRFTMDLAEALTRRPVAEILDRLQADAVVVGTGADPQWFRCHSLIRGYAYADVRRRHLEESLHARASAWFAAHDDIAAALEHAVAAADAPALTRLLGEYGLALVLDGRGEFLRRQFDLIPADLLDRPPVALVAAAVALDGNDVEVADQFLARLTAVPPADLDDRMRVMLAVLRLQRSTWGGDLPGALAGLTAVSGGPPGETDLDLFAATWRAIAAFALGDSEKAHVDLSRAARLARRAGHAYAELACLTVQASAAAARCDFVGMGEIAAEALELADARGLTGSPTCAYAYAVSAWSAYERMEPDSSRRFAALALGALGPAPHPTVEAYARSVEAAVRFDTGDRHSAIRDWLAVSAEVGDDHLPPAITAHLAARQVWMGLAIGEPWVAADAVDRIRLVPGADAEVRLFRAAIEYHRGRPGPARRLLEPVLADESPRQSVTTLIEAWLLEAMLAAGHQELELTRRAVDTALDLAVPLGALRDFVAAGPPLRDILLNDLGRFGVNEHFVVAVVAAMGPAAPVVQPLSPRERELLALLPTMRTVDEIAGGLYISASTVKTHLRSIYAKLGVGTRRDAVAAARRQGLP